MSDVVVRACEDAGRPGPGPLRVSIAGLLGVVLATALALAAVGSATDLWASVVLSLALAVLGFAALGALLRRGPSRAAWVGFVVIGWGYLALSSGPEVRARLLTTRLNDYIRARSVGSPRVGQRTLVEWGGGLWAATVVAVRDGKFRVHYDGWDAQFDEWVGPARLRPGPVPPPSPAGQPTGPVSALPSTISSPVTSSSFVVATPTGFGMPAAGPEIENHQVIGHAFFALAFGLAGAVAARLAFGST